MNKIYVIAAMAVMACGPRVSPWEICEISDKAQYDKTFSICMAGQRKITGTDDADDFVKECARAAYNIAKKCEIKIAVYDSDTGRNEFCGSAKIRKNIEACEVAIHGK